MLQKWKNKNVLITGINGFIGGNLAKYLIDQGAKVTGIVRNFDRETFLNIEGVVSRCVIANSDLSDCQALGGVLAENQIEYIFHLAAQVEVGVGMQNPVLTFESNIRGTYMLLEACRLYGKNIQSIIVASSDKAYGSYPKEKMPYQEDYPLIPVFPYDVSKACSDLIATSYASSVLNLPVIITRFCNIYGPGQMNFSALIPDSIRSALGYSEFTPRSDGKSVRDFIYITDVCELYSQIALSLSVNKKLSGEIFNAGTNAPISMREVIEKIFSSVGNNGELENIIEQMKGKKALGEIDVQFMDYNKVNKFFGWTPKTSFSDGLKDTIQWYKAYLEKSHAAGLN